MHSSGEREAVANAIRTSVRHRANVGGLNFRAAATIDELYAGDGAGVVVGRLDGCGESAVPKGPLHYLGDDPAIDAVCLVWHLRVVAKSDARFLERIRRWPFAVTFPEDMREASGEDQIILSVGDVPDNAAERAFVRRAIVLAQAALIVMIRLLEWDCMIERQEVLDQRVEVVGFRWVFDDVGM